MSGWPRGPPNHLHFAARDGSTERTVALLSDRSIDIDQRTPEGKNPNSHAITQDTPLMLAAMKGHLGAVKVLLGAKASPLLDVGARGFGDTPQVVPLDRTATYGHADVVRELLLQQVGIEGCSGVGGGMEALFLAASCYSAKCIEVMAVLTGAGVVDTGNALHHAASHGNRVAVKLPYATAAAAEKDTERWW